MKPLLLHNVNYSVCVHPQDIVYIHSDRHHCNVVMADGTIHVLTCTMDSLERRMPQESFVRISRMNIINVWHVQKVTGRLVFLTGDVRITIGETYTKALNGFFHEV